MNTLNKSVFSCTFCALLAFAINAQSQIITTIAGGGPANLGGNGGQATNAEMASPFGLAMDAAGNMYIADQQNNCIREVNASGIISIIAGTGINGYGGDGGNATNAMLNLPQGVAVDASGNVYLADTRNNRIRCVNTSGTIFTFAGNGFGGFSGDGGAASSCELYGPTDIKLDGSGNIYIADDMNDCIRKVNTSGIISTFAGMGGNGGFSGDGGPAIFAQLYSPLAIALDVSGNMYITDSFNYRIRKINTSGTISTIVGKGLGGYSGDGGPATSAEIYIPYGVTVDGSANIYISDYNNFRIRIVNSSGIISTLTGNGIQAFSGDGGPAASAKIAGAAGIITDASGDTYFSDMGDNRVRKINSSGIISTIAGSSNLAPIGNGGPATAASLSTPIGIMINRTGNIYVADYAHQSIRVINTAGIISNVAGNGIAGYSGDGGPATAAELRAPIAAYVDTLGQVYITDVLTSKLRMVNTLGIISSIAGIGVPGYSGDGGPATAAELSQLEGITTDNAGNILIIDGDRLRTINASGIISTIAGQTIAGFSGDGGPATASELSGPLLISTDGNGNIYIGDAGNSRIREINSSGIINTIAGNGIGGFSGDGGLATAAELDDPFGVATDAFGNLFITNNISNRIRMVNTSGIISMAVGNGIGGFYGDGGPATDAEISNPSGITFDASGNLFFSDERNNRLRMVTPSSLTSNTTVSDKENLFIYPNPATDIINVRLNGINGKTLTTLYGIMGNELVSQSAQDVRQISLNVSAYSAGIYLLKIQTAEGSTLIKKVEIIK